MGEYTGTYTINDNNQLICNITTNIPSDVSPYQKASFNLTFKIIDSNKLTFDSNGKIINFKPIKIETLSKDFASLKDGIKALDININLKKTTTRKNRINRSKETPKIKNSIKKEKEIITKNPEDDPNGVNKFKK